MATRWRRIYDAADYVAVALFGLLVALINIQVFYRYVLNHPLAWPEEIARATFIWIVYLGLVRVIRDDSHYRIDFLLNRMAPPLRRGTLLVLDLVALGFFVAVISDSYLVIASNWNIRTSIAMPVNVIYLSLPVAIILIVPLLVGSIFRRLLDGGSAGEGGGEGGTR